MIRLRHKLLIRIYRLIDQLILIGVAAAIVIGRPDLGLVEKINTSGVRSAKFYLQDGFGLGLLLLGWVIIYFRCIRYTGDRFTVLRTQLRNVINASTLASFWLLIVAAVFSFRSLTTANVIIFWISVILLGIATRFVMRFILMSFRKSGYNYRYLLLVGANSESNLLAQKIQSQPVLGYKIVGFVAESAAEQASFEEAYGKDLPVVGVLKDLQSLLKEREVDEMMVCFSLEVKFSDVAQVMHCAKDLGIVLRILPTPEEAMYLKGMHLESFDGRSLITLFRQQLLVHLLIKRGMDILFSGIGLLFLSPLFAGVALWIKLWDRGPIFFSQDRVGMNNRRFKMHKFRSMVVNAEELKDQLTAENEREGPVFKMKHDPRVTPVGRFLRKYSIDELPQLWNVFVGEMSLVGPRPPLPREVDGYEWKFRRRLSIPQGITCLWQVSGRDEVGFSEWMDLDAKYIDNWSVWLDLKILFLTIPAVMFSRGAS